MHAGIKVKRGPRMAAIQQCVGHGSYFKIYMQQWKIPGERKICLYHTTNTFTVFCSCVARASTVIVLV